MNRTLKSLGVDILHAHPFQPQPPRDPCRNCLYSERCSNSDQFVAGL